MTVPRAIRFPRDGATAEKSIDERVRDSVKICATRRVQFSIQLFGTGFRANRRIARGNWQRLSNGQNDYLHARLGAIPILQEADRGKIHPDCCFTLQNKLRSSDSCLLIIANALVFGIARRHTRFRLNLFIQRVWYVVPATVNNAEAPDFSWYFTQLTVFFK